MHAISIVFSQVFFTSSRTLALLLLYLYQGFYIKLFSAALDFPLLAGYTYRSQNNYRGKRG